MQAPPSSQRFDPLLSDPARPTFGRAAIPWELSEREAPQIPPLLRKYPEVLFCIGATLDEQTREEICEPLGLADTDPWTLFQCLVHDASSEEVAAFLTATQAVCHALVRHLRADDERPGPEIRTLGTRTMRRTFYESLQRYYAGDRPLRHVLNIVAMIHFDPSPQRVSVLGAIRDDVRKALESHYPDLLRIPVPDSDDVLSLHDLPQWIETRAREQENLERRLKRAQQKADELAKTLHRVREERNAVRREAEILAAANRQILEDASASHKATPAEPVFAPATPSSNRDRAHDDEMGAEIARLRSKLENEQRLRFEAEAELVDLLEKQIGADVGDDAMRTSIAGKRVLLLGGVDETLPALTEAVGAEGAELVHYDDNGQGVPSSLLRSVDLVVFKVRHLSHSTYYAVRDYCKANDVPFRYWGERSAETLIRALTLNPRHAQHDAGPAS